MFSLLNPITLWLGAAVLLPLAVHLLGREQRKREVFPSLMLLREQLVQSMARHRLKNILFLVLRTLLILALIGALTRPVLERLDWLPSAQAPVDMFFHNGAYSAISVGGDSSIQQMQTAMFQGLDSLGASRTRLLPLIDAGSPFDPPLERYGNYRAVIEHLMRRQETGNQGPLQLVVPVFRWRDLNSVAVELKDLLRQDRTVRLHLVDYSPLVLAPTYWRKVRFEPPLNNPALQASIQLSGLESRSSPDRLALQILVSGHVAGQYDVAPGERLTLPVPMADEKAMSGSIQLSRKVVGLGEFPYFFHYLRPERLLIHHLGNSLVSLPSLGEPTYYRRIQHHESPDHLKKALNESDGSGMIILANAAGLSAEFCRMIIEFVGKGGALVVVPGSKSDMSLLNRRLLLPMELGRYGNLLTDGATNHEMLEPSETGMDLPSMNLDFRSQQQFQLLLGETAHVLVRNELGPLLGQGDFHQGRVLIWASDIDDPDWTEAGLTPLAPLMHFAFEAQQLKSTWKVHGTDSDSLWEVPRELRNAPMEIIGPGGKPLAMADRMQSHHLGPFDQLGIYTIRTPGDSIHLAVNLAASMEGPDRDEFMEEWDLSIENVQVSSPDIFLAGVKEAYLPLWRWLLVLAILLLFAECFLSRWLGMKSS